MHLVKTTWQQRRLTLGPRQRSCLPYELTSSLCKVNDMAYLADLDSWCLDARLPFNQAPACSLPMLSTLPDSAVSHL